MENTRNNIWGSYKHGSQLKVEPTYKEILMAAIDETIWLAILEISTLSDKYEK